MPEVENSEEGDPGLERRNGKAEEMTTTNAKSPQRNLNTVTRREIDREPWEMKI